MSEAPKPTPRTPSSPGQRTITNPEMLKAVSAARAAPLPKEKVQGPLKDRLKSGATDTALNVAGILRDLWDDFRSADQYFKYKALILSVWVLLSGATLFVACPGGGGPDNNIGARLVRTKVLDSPVLMIVNDSGEPWRDVVVEVNHQYRAAVAGVSNQTPDNNLILEPRKLLGKNGAAAPSDLRITDLVVRTSEGRAKLIEHGQDAK